MITKKIELIKDTTCTGCSACANICPVGAIEMKEDERGFFKPYINLSRCINCGLCDKTCPILNDLKQESFEPQLFAMWADDETRLKSSSGGAFTVLAEEILERGGVVFGAVWGENFTVIHKVAENKEQLEPLKKSKYVQSFIGSSFKQVESYLLQKRPVLFVGTGCQIGGLKSYIKSKNIDDSNLFVVDLYCYNVPPQKTFKRYLKDNWGDGVENFEFRIKDKKTYTSHFFTVKLKNQEPFSIFRMSYWFKAYFSLMYECSACEKCKYQSEIRFGDVSIGDFWKIEDHDKSWNDPLGTSMIQANTEKGLSLINAIKQKCKRIEQTPMNYIRDGQSNGKKRNPNQQLFYDMLDQGIHFNKAVELALAGKKFDIGMCCVQVYNNYGSGITNYALYKLLNDYGKEVLIITQPKSSIISPENPTYFLNNPFPRENQAKFYKDKEEMKQLNKIVDKFLVGSDQLFNFGVYNYIDGFVKLDWVDDEHSKVSYATSFGMNRLWGSQEEINHFRKCIRRFDKVSVRESNAVDLVKNNFDIYADWVMDPVFLCKKEHFMALIEPLINTLPKNKAFCYVLDPDKDKEKALKQFKNLSGIDLFVVSDLANSQETLKTMWDIDCQMLKHNEEWLTAIYNSSYVIADSFHGLCFAILFNKPFIMLSSKRRGNERALSLMKMVNLGHRIIDAENMPTEEELTKLITEKINYDEVNKIIEENIKFSREWFEKYVIN